MDKQVQPTTISNPSDPPGTGFGAPDSDHSDPDYFRRFVEYLPTAMAMVDPQLRYLAVSRQWQQDYGEGNINLIGSAHQQWFPHLPEIWYQNAQQSLEGKLPRWELETHHPQAQGSTQWNKWVVQPWQTASGEIGGLILYLEVITPQKQLQEKLKLTQKAFDQAATAIFWMTLEGNFCYVNQSACRMLGYTESELLQLNIHNIDPDLTAVVWQEYCQELKQKGSLTFESSYQRKSGSIFPVNFKINYLELESSDPTLTVETELGSVSVPGLPLICGFAHDISEQKATSSAILASKDQLEAVLNAVPGLVSWISSDLKYLGVNRHLANSYNVPAETFIGKEVGFLQTSPEFNQFVYEFFAQDHWKSSRELTANVRGLPCTYLIVAQKYHRGSAAVFVGLDITERQQMEQALRQSEEQEAKRRAELETILTQLQRTQTQLIQTEKMSSLGQLVAGIAHEINNPVSFISGNIVHAKNYIEDLMNLVSLYQQYYPEIVPEIADEIEEVNLSFLKQDLPRMLESMKVGAERIRDVVRSLRHFTRLDESQMKFVDIHEGLDSTILILQNRLQAKAGRSGITLVKEYSALPKVGCYAGQLNQVFMNLLTYTIDRLEATSFKDDLVDQPKIIIRTYLENENTVAISIADNGIGMSEIERKSIFDPFIPPQLQGKGTSLGLSIAYHLVTDKHHGELTCFSVLGTGTNFLIEIPLGN
ncbi:MULTISPECIES: PAS domain S-box protein [Planktothrix]|uniref:histidine kinase n=1 Tax=Planktothrix rubescens CCAP 1459/22 TaxID=329571 RepID=A0A6J7ZFF1_PLARU|nr:MULTISPECIES: PAS domain S-box protein [Planktothrix]CAC5340135.1 Two-component sensor histidine kinase [Planktothrix rubescens NIVA-CYA 18]CAD5920449.1 Signal transduction histidine-protein kinase AtoS [Planktothrix rubescens]CAD5946786.1 Signal transduction histidine-protein kinase AtoS [Planktothrix rubescens NIVA-CYA 18]CAH2572812.1 Signal transduction histidine-protein kinase AtoS [Planktothrix rubescens]